MNPAEEAFRLMQASICFRKGEVCAVLPCACAETLGEALTRFRLQKRPVAFRVRLADEWILYDDEQKAYQTAEVTNAEMQGLYVRDGT